MAQSQQAIVRNKLLRALARDDFALLAPALEPITIPPHTVLIAPQQLITHAYFIEAGLVSLVADTGERRIEIGLVGREGMAGVALVLGADRTPHTALVQGELAALRITAAALEAALTSSRVLSRVLGRYAQSLLVQFGQTVHAAVDLTIEGRLARRILMTHDRLDQDELPLTHGFLGIMLGVRRAGVTNAIHVLQNAETIRTRRGRIIVLDRTKLKDMAGDTYGPAEAEYERLLPS